MADQQYGTPDWVNPANTTPAVVSDANVGENVNAGSGNNGQGSIREKNGCLLATLSLMNIGLAAMMTALGVLTIMNIHNGKASACTSNSSSSSNADDDGAAGSSSSSSSSSGCADIGKSMRGGFSEPFLAFYMILFATLLFLYELMYWSPLPKLNQSIRKNFGFMYGLRGKGLYLIFCGFLCFGLGKEMSVRLLNYFTGISWLLWGCFHVFITFSKPEVASEYQPPGSGFSSKAAASDDNVV